MQIEMRAIELLQNYEFNARTHSDAQISELMRAITEFGFLDPIEITPDNVIISGHGRIEAARRLGFKEVPCIPHKGLSESQRKAYVLAANRIAQNAGWDNTLLQHEFAGLLEAADIDLTLTGFSQDEIDALLNPEVELTLDDTIDSVAAEGAQTICKRGDVWLLDKHRLMCGDSTCADDVQKLCADVKPNLMVTDPPYGVNYAPEWREGIDGKKRQTGKVLNDDRADWTDAYSLFTGNVAYVWHSGSKSYIFAQNLMDCGFEIVSQIIWAKQHFVLSRGDYHPKHEPCFYAVRKGAKHSWCGKRDQSTVWEIANNNPFGNRDMEDKVGHGTQKPLECMSRPIENNSKPGEWVYDPFGGSGTTLIACEKLGRKCVMMELDERYCDVIIKRWQKATNKKAVCENTGEIFDDGTQKT